MPFKIIESITEVEIIARGKGITSHARLREKYGAGNWRKMKGKTRVLLENGKIHAAEVHWYEAHGIGKFDFKIKRFLD